MNTHLKKILLIPMLGLFLLIVGQVQASSVCGNGTVEGREECETGTAGCTSDCEWQNPSCELLANDELKTTVTLGESVTFETELFSGNVVGNLINFGNGYDSTWSQSMTYTYPTVGQYVAIVVVENPGHPDLQAACRAGVTVTASTCGNGQVETGEQCGEYDSNGNPLVSCSGSSVCNEALCTCQNVCAIEAGTSVDFYKTPLNFDDGRDAEVQSEVDHTYTEAGTYTPNFKVVNQFHGSLEAYCEEDVEIVPNACGNGTIEQGEECGEPGLSCSGGAICNPYSCECSNACNEITKTIKEECDDGKYCADGTACNYNSDCVGSSGGDELCLVRSGDGCSNTCEDEYCGDGFVDTDGPDNIGGNADDEECDDGNSINTDACTNRCTPPTCGDGVLDEDTEVCDAGSFCADGTDCTLDPTICPNGLKECKPRDTETCSASCDNVARCGDGIVQENLGEECDNGDNNSDYGACNTSCELTYCGDGTAQNPNGIGFEGGVPADSFGEQCDDGNDVNDDGCNNRCQADIPEQGACSGTEIYVASGHLSFPNSIAGPGDICDQGIPSAIEQLPGGGTPLSGNFTTVIIEDYNGNDLPVGLYDEGSVWYWDCVGTVDKEFCQTVECGDGVLQYNGSSEEECDDGNNINGDGCSATCKVEAPLQAVDFGGTSDISCIDDSEPMPSSISNGKNGVLPVVHDDEYLPVWWEADTPDQFIDWDAENCSDFDLVGAEGQVIGGIPGASMECEFVLSNANGNFPPRQPGEPQQPTFTVPCYQGVDTKGSNPTYDIFVGADPGAVTGSQILADAIVEHKAYAENSVDMSNMLGVHLLNLPSVIGTQGINYGQFKLKLTDVNYEYCAKQARDISEPDLPIETDKLFTNKTHAPTGGVCESKVSIGKGYLTQKGFTLQEVENSDLIDFLSYSNVELASEGTPLDPTADAITTIPEGDEGKDWLFEGFIEQYDKSGIIERQVVEVVPGQQPGWNDINARLYKVPNETIFFYQKNEDATGSGVVTMNDTIMDEIFQEFGLSSSQPFTFVVEDTNVTMNIDADLSYNGAYIVNGDISFNPQSCDDNNVVEGIFIANGIFKGDEIRNDELTASERCAGGSLKVDGVLVGEGIDENFANARRSSLSAWPTNAGVGLFDDSLPGKARELFNVCYLPNLLNFEYGRPVDLSSPSDQNPKFGRPVTVTENADGNIMYSNTVDWKNVCTIASFPWGKNRISQNLSAPSCGSQIDCLQDSIVTAVNSGETGSMTSLNVFKEYARNTVNAHVYAYLSDQNNFDGIAAALGGRANFPNFFFENKSFICDTTQNTPGCFEVSFYDDNSNGSGLQVVNRTVYKPAWDQARRMTMQYTYYEDQTNAVTVSFMDIRDAFAGFDDIYDSLNVTVANGGILGLFNRNNFFYTDFVGNYFNNNIGITFQLFNPNILNYLDFSWIDTNRNNVQLQNIERSENIFEGSAVLLQLNAAKRTQLSPGLKDYLDSTIVEK